MKRLSRFCLLALICFPSASSLRGGEITFTSRPLRAHLIELFTSEGCSSCPPAEAWLNKLKDDSRLWQDFVPLAFHVDYWDRLGWRDPFASKTWTARQYDYSSRWGGDSVYTPGFVLDGREWRSKSIPIATETAGVLKVAIANNGNVTATFAPAGGDARSFELHVARLGFGINVDVKAGENSGRKLGHDFVVIALETARMDSGKTQLRLPNDSPAHVPIARTAIAAWVTLPGKRSRFKPSAVGCRDAAALY